MHIAGASVYLPSAPERVACGRPYAYCRPQAADEELLVGMALPVCWRILKARGLDPLDLDLLISVSVSPDHLVGSKEVAAPRLCHPLQRDLGARNAFVFDLIDADWTTALDVAEGFMRSQDYRWALLIRAEHTSVSMLPDAHSGFGLADGVGALLVTLPADGSLSATPVRYEQDTEGWEGLRIDLLPPETLGSGSGRCQLTFAYEAGKAEMLTERASDMARQIGINPTDVVLTEAWLPGQPAVLQDPGKLKPHACYDYLGPFGLPYYAEQLLQDRPSAAPIQLVSVTLNPFLMRYAGRRLTL
ncbi:beta-ketoacyl-[acyl-carrier-protein] synthase family protein [Hymenobacter rubripertinctus]|uniref:Uncharacterized protein n=1 Tax=Hymenobacter rubripertinctus TaxID=2029981 RepID=A0A418QWH0_9BACT|nr:hypothetical protein [Hymenobacter rubripertinctus]RIY09565.1 hypothetical protein D0T11_12150 [Hymenobacter rubripertinctus]